MKHEITNSLFSLPLDTLLFAPLLPFGLCDQGQVIDSTFFSFPSMPLSLFSESLSFNLQTTVGHKENKTNVSCDVSIDGNNALTKMF